MSKQLQKAWKKNPLGHYSRHRLWLNLICIFYIIKIVYLSHECTQFFRSMSRTIFHLRSSHSMDSATVPLYHQSRCCYSATHLLEENHDPGCKQGVLRESQSHKDSPHCTEKRESYTERLFEVICGNQTSQYEAAQQGSVSRSKDCAHAVELKET